MLFKKNTKAPETENDIEAKKKIEQTKSNFRVEILKLGTMQKNIVEKIVECKKKGMTSAAESFRGKLAVCLNEIKKREEQLMQIELAEITKNLMTLNASFVDSLDLLAQQTLDAAQATDTKRIKKVHKKYMKAQYAAQMQNAQIDMLMDAGKFSEAASMGTRSSEYDDQIDNLVNLAEQNGGELPADAVILTSESLTQDGLKE